MDFLLRVVVWWTIATTATVAITYLIDAWGLPIWGPSPFIFYQLYGAHVAIGLALLITAIEAIRETRRRRRKLKKIRRGERQDPVFGRLGP